jgi:hypothetical protein
MADLAAAVEVLPKKNKTLPNSKLGKKPSGLGIAVFVAALASGLCYIAFHLARDLETVTITSIWP